MRNTLKEHEHGRARLRMSQPRLVVVLFGLSILALTSCTTVWPQGGSVTVASPLPYGSQGSVTAMRGDPGFARSQLTALERTHYDRLLQEINDPDNFANLMREAGRNDIYHYGRRLHTYVQPILTVFRITGDLTLLDHVDIIAERMRQELRDEWHGTNDGTDGTKDGYLNWVYRYRDTPQHQGKDTRHIDDIKTHSLIAMIAYALDLNRDLASPTGRDYAAHADFWKDYLVNHFEAKWRERRGIATAFPFLSHSDAHAYHSWTKWHYFMGLLTGNAAYSREAHRMADVIWGEIRAADTPAGPAYVWTSNISALSTSRNYLMTTSYANSIYGDIVTFHLEGFHHWADATHLTNFARSITALQFDTDDVVANGIAGDIGGNSPHSKSRRAGLPADHRYGRPVRRSASTFALYEMSTLAPWDETGEMVRVGYDVQEAYPEEDTARLAAALFLSAHLNTDATAAALR